MSKCGLASNFRRDTAGATFVEFTAVFPLIMLVMLGAVDFSFLVIDWVSLNRATYVGARVAVVSDPVATGINAATAGTTAGASCFDYTTGSSTGNCTARAATVCTGGTSDGSCCPAGSTPSGCTANYTWNETTFAKVLAEMNKYMINQPLDRRQVQVIYTPTGYGYALRPNGPPMTVTVQVRCVRYPFYFLRGLMGWAFPAQSGSCANMPGTGVALPQFPTTLPAEDLSG